MTVGNGGTGASNFTNNGVILGNGSSNLLSTAAGNAYQSLVVPAGGGTPSFSAINLSQSAAVTGILPTSLGGTGVASAATFPASGVIVTQTASETLNNKTLTSPIISGSTPGVGKVLTSDANGLASWSTDGSALTNLNPTNLAAVVSVSKGGTGANLQSTGGTGQYLKQSSAGANISVGTIDAADLPPMIGDSGSGGTKGAVPAPGSGDAAGGKFLKANGTWSIPTFTPDWAAPGAIGATTPNTGSFSNLTTTGSVGIGTTVPDPASLGVKAMVSGGSLVVRSPKSSLLRYMATGSGLTNISTLSLWYSGAYNDTTDGMNASGGSITFGGAYHAAGYENMFAGIRGAKESTADQSGNGYLSFHTFSNPSVAMIEQMRITSTGNVGIGTTAPLYLLNLRNTATTPDTPMIAITDPTNNRYAAGIGFNSATRMSFYSGETSGNGSALTASHERLVITTAGNVGIGTTSPTGILEVKDSFVANKGTIYLRPEDNGSEGGQINLSPGGGKTVHWTLDNYDNRFRLFSDSTEDFTILANGNVGIGTASPQAALDVSGTQLAQNLVETRGLVDLAPSATVSVSGGSLGGGGPGLRGYDSFWRVSALGQSITFDLGGTDGFLTGITFGTFWRDDVRWPPAGYSIDYSTDNTTWTNLVTVSDNTKLIVTHMLGFSARYVRLTVNSFQSGQAQSYIAGLRILTRSGGNLSGSSGWGAAGNNLVSAVPGNIGIGTTAPSEKLHVQGDIYLTGAIKGSPTWTLVTFTNGWSNYGGSFYSAAYHKDKLGYVHLRGLVKAGTCGTSIFTLPVGMRPSGRLLIQTISRELAARLDISEVGEVVAGGWPGGACNNEWFSLDNIQFLAEQ